LLYFAVAALAGIVIDSIVFGMLRGRALAKRWAVGEAVAHSVSPFAAFPAAADPSMPRKWVTASAPAPKPGAKLRGGRLAARRRGPRDPGTETA